MGHLSSNLIHFVVLVALLSGCAASPAAFYADATSIGNVKLCRTLRSAESDGNVTFAVDVRRAIHARGLNDYSCNDLISQQNASIAAAFVVGAAAIAVARTGGGGSGSVSTGYATYDYDWDWDQFYNQNYQLVWACRGMQTGQFASPAKCAYKTQTDFRWPAKNQ